MDEAARNHRAAGVAFLDGVQTPELVVETSPQGQAFYDDQMRIRVKFSWAISVINYLGIGMVNGT
jgi:hypothetical protein